MQIISSLRQTFNEIGSASNLPRKKNLKSFGHKTQRVILEIFGNFLIFEI